jgi:hypothetical protein
MLLHQTFFNSSLQCSTNVHAIGSIIALQKAYSAPPTSLKSLVSKEELDVILIMSSLNKSSARAVFFFDFDDISHHVILFGFVGEGADPLQASA